MLSDRDLKVTLWGQRSKSFTTQDFYNENNPRAIVVLFVGCVPKEFQSKFVSTPFGSPHKVVPVSILTLLSLPTKNITQRSRMLLEIMLATGI